MERLAKLLLFLLNKILKSRKTTFRVLMIDGVIGVLEWHLAPSYSERVEKFRDADDPNFVRHHLRAFLVMLLATLTCKDPGVKRMHKDVIRNILLDYNAKMKENYPSASPS